MGFLDKKERILDIVLTDRGRELLSQNQLVVRYYAFSDDGVNYTGSLSSSVSISGSSVDYEVHKTLLFEATQKNDKSRNLNNFLYTVPERANVLPEFIVRADISSSISLERRYHIETITLEAKPKVLIKKPVDVIVRAKIDKSTAKDRIAKYVLDQRISDVLKNFFGDKEK